MRVILLISVLIFSILLFGCATPMVHDTKTDSYKDRMDCANNLYYQSWKVDDCMIKKHGWKIK